MTLVLLSRPLDPGPVLPESLHPRQTVEEREEGSASEAVRRGMTEEESEEESEEEFARILERVKRGEPGAQDELLRSVYAELHALATRHMRGQPPGHTLQPTVILNEAWLRLFRRSRPEPRDRTHFLRAASRAMRSVLVDHARAKARLKRAAPGERTQLEDLAKLFTDRAQDLLVLDEALTRLEAIDPRAAEGVVLRFFGGRTDPEVAEILGVSLRTVERDWALARAWLRRELG